MERSMESNKKPMFSWFLETPFDFPLWFTTKFSHKCFQNLKNSTT